MVDRPFKRSSVALGPSSLRLDGMLPSSDMSSRRKCSYLDSGILVMMLQPRGQRNKNDMAKQEVHSRLGCVGRRSGWRRRAIRAGQPAAFVHQIRGDQVNDYDDCGASGASGASGRRGEAMNMDPLCSKRSVPHREPSKGDELHC